MQLVSRSADVDWCSIVSAAAANAHDTARLIRVRDRSFVATASLYSRRVAPPIVAGTIVDRYRVDRVIGAGSMGDVFLAHDDDLHRQIALKILNERHRDNDELRARFVREGRAVAAISHPNVVQVFTTGNYDERPYIAMEYLDGVDLGSEVATHGPWTSVQAAKAVLDAARGLEAAARAGLIHRDVKPSNLVLLADGSVKVTDFGLAKPVDPGTEPALTALGVVVGTPDYIAPEQARGEQIDERVDIYALGGTLYFLLVGTPPFRTGRKADDKYLKVVARHLRQPAPDARTAVKTADRELSELARRMMAKKPVDRPDYAELIDSLSAIVDRLEGAIVQSTRRLTGDSGPGGRVAPTPFVGGAGPRVDALIGKTTAGTSDPDDAAPTKVHLKSGAMSSQAGPRPRASRLLIVATVGCALVFLTGLYLVLWGPMPRSAAGSESKPVDAGSPRSERKEPVPPKDMVLVRKPDGSPWFFVDKRPVRHGEYAAAFPRRKQSNPRVNHRPVTDVSYVHAQSFARANGKRLLRAAEWAALTRAPGVELAARLWEWVDDEATGDQQAVRKGADQSAKRNAVGHRDVTFRLAMDL